MTSIRILHVDDEPDIREVVELSLTLDPAFAVRSCACGLDALAVAAEWNPDLILCDVTMPGMDGPATLAQLRSNPQTAGIPLVFMTARAQNRELEHFTALGAIGVVLKPFDPMTLVDSVHAQLRCAKLVKLRSCFIDRLGTDAAKLVKCRTALLAGTTGSAELAEIKSLAHALAGAAGLFDFQAVSRAAFTLESAVIDTFDGHAAPEKVHQVLDALIDCIAAEMARVANGKPKPSIEAPPLDIAGS